MQAVSKLLGLIESVSPDDTAKNDEINALVAYFLNDVKGKVLYEQLMYNKGVKYTRSLDAQEAIDTEGWFFNISIHSDSVDCYFHSFKAQKDFEIVSLPTEPLARLHAKIQCVQWDRDNEKS